MPRVKSEEKKELPKYIRPDGTLEMDKIFKLQPVQKKLLNEVVGLGGKIFTRAVAEQCLSTGGIRSGKTTGWLMHMVMSYCLTFKNCDMLVLRRTFKDLESGAIADFKTFVPKELYTYDSTKHVATFFNGSRCVFGHCQNNKEKDIEQYLGQAYPAILVDECGQFSPDAWMLLYSRNVPNAACKEDEFGNMPIPVIAGCTNPLGPHYEFYRKLFVEKEPWQKPDGSRKDESNGTWWAFENGEWNCIHDPKQYAYQRSTVLDNPIMQQRDPGLITRLRSMPKAKRDKLLHGLDGKFEGQYFDCFDEAYHVINLREDPEAIVWQHYQPVWAGEDWGMGHANATYLFTKALVRSSVGNDYKMKTVCFQEIVVTGGKTYKQLASLISAKAKYPDGTPAKIKSIYFSHEKFSASGSEKFHTPADEYSTELRALKLPPVTRGTTDRIGSASYMYNAFQNGSLVILDHCSEIVRSIPSLMRDPDNLDDVLKTATKGDDCYDGFRLGLYGEIKAKGKPREDAIRDHAATLDPLAAFFYKQKMMREANNAAKPFIQEKQPQWLSKINNL